MGLSRTLSDIDGDFLQYASNLITDTTSLVYCLTMFDVCHMFVL